MSASTVHPAAQMGTPWRQIGLWSAAHTVDDLFQSLVPAAIPFFVIDRHFSYVAASGLVLAATAGGALPQLGIGVIVDRFAVPWFPAIGLLMTGVGFGLAGLAHSPAAAYVLIAISGLGVAVFHPAAGKAVRAESGGSVAAMSMFAAGGSFGSCLAPILATPVFVGLGLGASPLFVAPAALMAAILFARRRRPSAVQRSPSVSVAHDRRGRFAVLVGVEVVRASVSTGITTFIALYWVRQMNASAQLGEMALLIELAGGAVGTLAGGQLAQRLGTVRTIQLGNLLLMPALIGLVLCKDRSVGLLVAFVLGVITTIPFAVLIKLGQDYLPSRPGTAAGVTYGLSVSAGGLLMPLLGLVAQSDGLRAVLAILAGFPVLAVALSIGLREPTPQTPCATHRGSPQ